MSFTARKLHKREGMTAVILSALIVCSCQPQQSGQTGSGGSNPGIPTATSTAPGSSGVNNTHGSVGDPLTQFKSYGTTKVIFNKKSFFNNNTPGPGGCAGDARYYYDPITDRKVPVKPDFVKNVAVDITNSNAPNGPSRAIGCALSGLGSAPAANCASFDDLQSLDGTASRSILIGGYGCNTGTTSCLPNAVLNDVWNILGTDLTTSTTWAPQSSGIPVVNTGVPGAAPGLVWHSGGYDEMHDQFYTFGGATPAGNLNNTTQIFTNQVTKISFNADGTVATNPGPHVMNVSSQRFYAGWGKQNPFDAALAPFFPPPAMTGANFTYAIRRDPSMKSQCHIGDVLGTWTCSSSKIPLPNPMIAVNQDHDYFLLTGGMPISGQFSKSIYIYKPHGFSTDVGTSGTPTQVDGDWDLVSNVVGSAAVSAKVMSVVDLMYVDATTSIAPLTITNIGSARPTAATDIFSGWLGRAYHRSVYDQGMNRFYIYGGVQNNGILAGAPNPATAIAPDLASSDVWIYDPPAIGRRPTAACFTNLAPDNVALPSPTVAGAARNLGINRNYLASQFVFPPGGCLQRVFLPNAPPPRFEHSMAFDRDSKAMVVFGGCKQTAIVQGSNTTGAGDPTLGCSSGGALLNDTWIYMPPTVTELVSKNFSTIQVSPFNPLTLLPNVFGTDFWLDHLPLFTGDNTPSNPPVTAPTADQMVGNWIPLTPAKSPPPRTGASFVYDRSHHKYYLQGGFGCIDAQCSTPPKALNDLWQFIPPDVNDPTQCDRVAGTCNPINQGIWIQVRPDKDASASEQPTERKGALMAYATPMYTYGDEFYTVTDSACPNQGPIASADSSISKELVGAIYVDIDRSVLGSRDNVLINLRFLPFDNNTKAPGFFDNNTPSISVDDTDSSASTDQAIIRVQLLNNGLKFPEQIQSSNQPRYHEFISGTPIVADTFMYVSGASGQITEKQIHVPLAIDPNINLIKIERVQGSVKFYEMTITKF